MTITSRPGTTWKSRHVVLFALGLPILAAVVLIVMQLQRPPQMGADEEVFRAVDALFTAVTARDNQLLAQCEQRLHALCDAGQMPIEAAAYLEDVIARARGGRWESAAERLYNFMKVQRREEEPQRPRS